MTSWNLESAVVPVTGAASGIGLAICKRLHAEGATPLLLDLDGDKLGVALREVYGSGDASGRGYVLDVRDARAVDDCLARIRDEHGRVTHAVANAGRSLAANILDITDEQWHGVMDVNLHGVMYFCRAAARQLAFSSWLQQAPCRLRNELRGSETREFARDEPPAAPSERAQAGTLSPGTRGTSRAIS